MNMNRIARVLLLGVLGVASLHARAEDAVDGATVKGGKVYCVRGDLLEPLAENLAFPSDVQVTTNGDFRVATGKVRTIRDGQILRRDGWLVNPDGSVESVIDHIAMKEGKVFLVRDGQAEALTKPMSFPNRLQVSPDGQCVYPKGSRTRLLDGQLFRLDGTSIPAKDTITLKDGRVVVQKEGSLIPLSPKQIITMNDGTRVEGDGFIVQRDGTRTKLSEGKTILVEGAMVDR
jgi:hypothetical protein